MDTIEDKDVVGYEFLNTLESLPKLANDLKKNFLSLDSVKLAMFPECEKEVDPDIIKKIHALLGTYNDIFDWEDGTTRIEKSCFCTKFGSFEMLRMGQGSCNSPSTFQRVIDICFQIQSIMYKVVVSYLDALFLL